jgi:Lar family restriction alleviation protein
VSELKPCPFCGNASRIHAYPYGSSDYRAWVECDSCAATGPTVSSDVPEAEAGLLAETLWNRRKEQEKPQEGAE